MGADAASKPRNELNLGVDTLAVLVSSGKASLWPHPLDSSFAHGARIPRARVRPGARMWLVILGVLGLPKLPFPVIFPGRLSAPVLVSVASWVHKV